MPWGDFLELVALNSISPISYDRTDYVSALHTAHLLNAWKSAESPVIQPSALMPFQKPDPEAGFIEPESDEDEMRAIDDLFSHIKPKGT